MSDSQSRDHRGNRLIKRYSPGERTNHWAIALTFILLALSGLALFHPAFFWLSNLFGGGPWTRILHPFIGLVMFFCFVVFAGHMWRNNIMTKADRQWLSQLDDVIDNREEKLPEVGKYNAGQKLLFYVLILCMLGLFVSGISDLARILRVLLPDLGHPRRLGAACRLCAGADLRDHCAYLRGDLGQGFLDGDAAGPCDGRLGVEASSRLVPRAAQEARGQVAVAFPDRTGRTAARPHAGRAAVFVLETQLQRILPRGEIEALDHNRIPRIQLPERASVFATRACVIWRPKARWATTCG